MILKYLLSIPTAIRSGYNWQKALSLATNGDFDNSLIHLDKVERTKSFSIEIDMLKAYLLDEKSRYHEAYSLCRSLIGRIHQFEFKSENERNYCLAYVKWIMALNEEKITPKNNGTINFKKAILQEIILEKIPNHWKGKFPLRIHPDWQES